MIVVGCLVKMGQNMGFANLVCGTNSFTHKTKPTRVYVESVSQKLKPQNHVFCSIFPPGRFFATLGFDQTPLQLQIDIY